MRTTTINLNNKPYTLMILSSVNDINKGMSIYDTPPSTGMLFELRGLYTMFTMNGVKFPIHVYLYDNNRQLIYDFVATPDDKDTSILSGIWYMIEIPLKY